MRTAHRTCPLCEAVCGLTLTIDDGGRVTGVRGDDADPFSKGFICPKGASLGRLDDDPDRLSGPLVRRDGEWHEVSWAEAFEAVERGLAPIPGPARALYLGNPNAHTMAGLLYGTPLARSLGTRQIYSASTADQMPKHVSAGLMFGHPLTIPVPDLDRTGYLLMLGANPLESNGSLCTAPDFPGRLKRLRARGGRLVVVDPRRTRTAALADEHVFIRPGTDAHLLMGIVHTLFAENLTDVRVPVSGLAELEAAARDFTAQACARVCGVPAELVTRLARELAAAPTAAVYSRMGASTVEFGTLTQWLVDAVNVLTGNLDRPGGAMFPRPAAEGPPRRKPYATGRWHSRVRGLPEANGELPVATLAEEIETPGEGRIRALVTVAGNPVLSAPNGTRLDAALAGLDFMVSVDPYLNETTRHAHVILPPPRVVQSAHYDFALLGLAVRDYARFSPPVVPLDDGRPAEAEIFARLAMIASGQGAGADPALLDELILDQMLRAAVAAPGSPVEGRDPAELRAMLTGATGPELRLDAMLRLGPYGDWGGRLPWGGNGSGEGMSLATLLDNPHGVDIGPLKPRLPALLATASKTVELAPGPILADVPRLREALGREAGGFVLIGRRHLRSNNSWMHNVAPLVGGTNRCTLQINPGDVARLGLGEHAVVRSAAGELTVRLEPTDTIMPGVVSLPHGWGHAGTAQLVAAKNAGVSANALTDESVVDPLSGNAVFNGVPVTLSPA
ncbi:molybdopterin-dependent oxidoreductase [Sphaerisporangium sp. TRM90804]|uniref:molybdopterin-dependent oxidoreductase n=1 Tax=Sphaerisporangium sp. TRM90804 TaxID=3031113 RepID=UPI00244910A1|nr:molybdopterin-dependent oxidoreductase [Sphaerisporangium sp. TRM90804]MDH2426749.1 molybdopterin-dependent oxidoreductase [Sphaerisporangium sp. TRM90804]